MKLFEDFHKYAPKEIGKFHASFYIPDEAYFVGPAIHVLYRSAKCDPVTYIKPKKPINYIHTHKSGVKVCLLEEDLGPARKVPATIHSVEALTLLGKCLGFAYIDEDDDEIEAECTNEELYATPSGKALLVIQNKRRVMAIIWGGKLDVEPRGIVG